MPACLRPRDKLSKAAPTDPTALWAYLHVMGGRQLPMGDEYFVSQLTQSTAQEDAVPALDASELDDMMVCYRSLRTRRPELAAGLVLLNVSDELKRALVAWRKKLDSIARSSPARCGWARSPAPWCWPPGAETSQA